MFNQQSGMLESFYLFQSSLMKLCTHETQYFLSQMFYNLREEK